jgi:predicted O-linked N-acetylglucosamine transferase (SPINDLY family)
MEEFKTIELSKLLKKLECDNIDNIKKCYHIQVLKLHPDKNPNTTQQFIDVQEAYELLTGDSTFYIKQKWDIYQTEQICKAIGTTKPFESVVERAISVSQIHRTMDNQRWLYLCSCPMFATLWKNVQEATETQHLLGGIDNFLEFYYLTFSLHYVLEILYSKDNINLTCIEEMIGIIS